MEHYHNATKEEEQSQGTGGASAFTEGVSKMKASVNQATPKAFDNRVRKPFADSNPAGEQHGARLLTPRD